MKKHIQDANLPNLIGAFMTDISEEIKTDSAKVYINDDNPSAVLIQKITSIDKSNKRYVICFGDKAFKILRKGLRISSRPVSTNPANLTMY